jgi:ADP-ribosylglycohydrolase
VPRDERPSAVVHACVLFSGGWEQGRLQRLPVGEPERTVMARTSLTHPLEIAEVPLSSGGAVGITFCPGKRQPRAATGAWHRDLALDLDRVEGWGTSAVVTLMEAHELAAMGVADLGEAVEALGIEWHHLPIPDVGVPDAGFEAHWVEAGLRLRRRLLAGGRVLVHCRGGLGRGGTIAARLLVELGCEPERAVTAVRRVRPGAIETRAQERHVLAARPPAFDTAQIDRLLGCLLGGAVGDAFGYTVEFLPLGAIRERFGPAGIEQPVLEHGRLVVSDDTQMTLFTLEGMLRALRPDGSLAPDRLVEEVRRAYLDWLDTQSGRAPGPDLHGALAQAPALRARRAPGVTCLSALQAGGRGTPERPINDSKGCGAVMRVAPLAFLPVTPEEAFAFGAATGALTHGHADGWLSSALLARILRALALGEPLPEAAAGAIAAGRSASRPGTRTFELAAAACDLAARPDLPPEGAIRALGQGWTGEEALAIGLYAALSGRDLVDALRRAANHDGDSDSTASIAGQLVGAWRGLDAVPHRLARRLDVADAIAALAQAFAAAAAVPSA